PGIWYTSASRAALIPADCTLGLNRFKPRTKFSSIADGTSNTMLMGEKHVRPTRFGESDEDNSVYNGVSPFSHIRVAGPGYEVALSPTDTTNASLIFGSYHQLLCNFLLADGHVISLRNGIGGTVLSRPVLRDDGQSFTLDD